MSTGTRLTLEQLDQMIEAGYFDDKPRMELIRGELREMVPIGPPHEDVVDTLNEWSIQKAPLKKVRVRIQNSVGLPELDSAPEPDVDWMKRKRYSKRRPVASDVLLLVEVAFSSLRYDRGEKADLYAEVGIRDYWIVNIVDFCVEVRRKPKDGVYQELLVHQLDETVSPLHFPELKLPVSDLFLSE